MRVRRGSILAHILSVYQLLPKVLRLTAYLLFLGLAASGFSVYRARAQLSESLMNLGADMLRYEGAEHQQAPRTLVLNGQPIHVATGHTRHPIDQVLDYYETRCNEHDGRLGEQLEAALERTSNFTTVNTKLLDATLRQEDDEHGFVACVDSGEGELSIPSFVERMQAFMQSMDLSDVGNLRYVYAQQNEDATTFITVWVEGSLDLGAMFPAAGDAPGEDLVNVPRPVRSRRIFSTQEWGKDKKILMYETDEPRASVEAFYKREMPALHWLHVQLTEEDAEQIPFPVELTNDDLMVFKIGRRMVAVMVMDDVSDEGKTVTTVLEI